MRTSTFIALTLIVAFGCTAPVGPSDSAVGPVEPTPGTTPLPSPSPDVPSSSAGASAEPSTAESPRPTAPPDLARIAVVKRDKIRFEIELQRNPLPAGQLSWVKVRVTNEGGTDVTWAHDGCAEPVAVRGASEVAWPMGEEHQGQTGMFKTYALGGHITAAPDPHGALAFVEERFLHSGPPGCADIGITDTIKPGETVRKTSWWSGFTEPNRALPPAGPATIRGFAGYYWRGKEPTDITHHAIELELDAWISSDAAADRLSPAQAVDAALSDPSFAAYLETQKIADGRAEIAWYDADRDLWEIGVMPWYETEPPRIHGVLVDAVTGRILGSLDRPWDQAVDPFPM